MKRGVHAVAWVLLAVAAFVLWPERLGGSMTYVITTGTSMEPQFTAGDLAVLRSADDYEVGDVVAFRSDEIKRVVMHRVIAEDGGVYTFQGDNNDFVDPDEVTGDQMLGKLALRVPGVGKYLGWVLQPMNLVILAVAAFFLFGDRKKDGVLEAGAAAPVGRIRLRSLQVPASAVTAEVADQADLERLAAHYDRPVLEVEGDDRRYVLDGSVVYTWAEAAAQPRGRRSTPQGRDWNYEARHLKSVPEADEDERRVSSL